MRSLGLDVGTTNVKAVAVDITGGRATVVAQASAPTPAGGVALQRTVARLVGEVGADVAAVGVASMAETGVPLDGDGVPLGDLVRWDPSGAQHHASVLATTYGAGALFAATGVRPSGKVPLAVWAQLRAEAPDRWAGMARWAGAADLVVLALTGRLATDHTLAGRTMAYRLPAPGEPVPEGFDVGLLSAVGLRPEQLPAVVTPGEVAGRVRAGGTWGLRAGTPVVVAGHDHPVGAWAAGVRAPGDVADSVGTAESVVRVLTSRPDPVAVATAGMSLVRTVEGRHEALVAGSATAGGVLAWWAERVGGFPALASLLDDAVSRPRSAGSPLLLPYLRGRQAPCPDPWARAVVVGRVPGHDDVDLAAAVLDGLALQARWMLTAQAELAGADPAAGQVCVLGSASAGGSAWLRAKAAAGPAPLRVVGEREAVAVGAAVLAAHRAGLAEALVLASEPVAAGREPVYDALFTRFVSAALGDA
ncbi:FGGY family carbohydrate kinase [Georgenia satyanarayanai]|uniref:FGGY-family carbohydrate kinase n=1 Tax=Georgenia satyanarayanai TaxID=860221 RepID=UPI0020421256|nr:FGGY family carbohydrate kinase [Georgenia satyanarayanai]MCM3661980.1 FGGY family carbohydrate kinase [Georgenia satyanarayanai]